METVDPRLGRAKSGGWSATGKLRQGDPTKQVTLQVQFPVSNNYTVQFKVDPQDPGAEGGFAIPEAEIVWSVEGNSITRRVSVTNGLAVTGVGQACRVTIRDMGVVNVGFTGQDYNASVQIAPGTRANVQNPPQLDGPFLEFGPGPVFIDTPIPKLVGICSVAVLASTNGLPWVQPGGILVQHISAAGVFNAYDPRQYFWVPIAPQAITLRITNFEAFNDAAKIIWGIDG